MKRKMACFLAAVMTVTALPTNVLAATPARIATSTGRTAAVRLTQPTITTNHTTTFVESGSPLPSVTGDYRGQNWAQANELAVVFDEAVVGSGRRVQFTVELDNAEWFFQNNNSRDNSDIGGSNNIPGLTQDSEGRPTGNFRGATYDVNRGTWRGDGGNGSGTYTRYADPTTLFNRADFVEPNNYAGTWAPLTGADLSARLGNRVQSLSTVPTALTATQWNDLATALNAHVGTNPANIATFDWTAHVRLDVATNVLYEMQVSRGNPRLATVTLGENVVLESSDIPDRATLHRSLPMPQDDNPTDIETAPDVPGIEAPMAELDLDAIETFGKKKQREQAPEGETAPAEQAPADKTAEAVLVDAMDPMDDYARVVGSTSTAERLNARSVAAGRTELARVESILELIEYALEGNLAGSQNRPTVTQISGFFGNLTTVADTLLNNPATGEGHIAGTGFANLVRADRTTASMFNSGVPTVNPVAAIASALSSTAEFGQFSVDQPGDANGNREERIQYGLNQSRLGFLAFQNALEGVANHGTALEEGPAKDAVLSTLAALLTNLYNLDNAIQYGTPGGPSTITLGRDTGITIPLVTRSTGNNQDLTVRVTQSSPIPISSNTLVFARTAGGTAMSIRSVAIGRERINLEELTVRENHAGFFPASPRREDGAVFELVAPAGFRFANNLDQVEILPEGGMGSISGAEVVFADRGEGRVIQFRYTNLVPSDGLTGSLVFRGLVLVSNNPESVRDRDLELQIRRLHRDGVDVTEESVLVANTRDFNVTMTAAENLPTLVNGRLDSIRDEDVRDEEHRAARVRISEVIENSLWNGRDLVLTLPREVRVRKAAFRNTNGINQAGRDLRTSGWFYNDRGREIPHADVARGEDTGNTPVVRVNDNVITIRGLERGTDSQNRAERMHFDVDLWLNIESGFTGDIELTLGGSALTSDVEEQTVVIAKAINPVDIHAQLQNVRMGYTFTPVGNFSITENIAGALQMNEDLYVSVTDEFFSEIHIGANFRAEVTEGDLRIRNVRASNNLGNFNNWNNNMNWRLGTNAIVEIDRESSKPSTIEFTNVALRLSPVSPIPQGQHTYSLVAWGPAVAQNFEGIRNRGEAGVNPNEFFQTPGIMANFIQALGAGASGFRHTVEVTVNSPVITMDGQQMLMDTAAYISPTSESLMVPVRFVAMALGLEPGRVLWNNETRMVTVDAGERIVQFTVGSSTMLINGIEFPMQNALGQQVYTEVRDDRAFIPFRPLADALNVYVAWNPATNTATFDPSRPSDRNFHLEDLLAGGNGTTYPGAANTTVGEGAVTVTTNANRLAGPVRTQRAS